MNTDLSATVGGQTLRSIRDYFRKYRRIDADTVSLFFHLGSGNTKRLINELCAAGFIEKVRIGGRDARFELTAMGRRLKETKALKRIPRTKAEAIIEQFKLKIDEVNARNDLIYYVREARAFGSYIENTPDLGDVDVAVLIKPRAAYQTKPVDASLARAEALGKNNLSAFQLMAFGHIEVKQLLQRTSRHLSVHEMIELETLAVASVLLFRADQPI